MLTSQAASEQSLVIDPSSPSLPQSRPVLSLPAYAKINLFLHIIGRRPDNYHDLQTVFRLLNWGDTLHFWQGDLIPVQSSLGASQSPSALTFVKLMAAEHITSNITDNLIVKASQALLDYLYGTNNQHSPSLPTALSQVSITVDKLIPMGAGLGGGSSNAATTLLALNQLWQLQLNQSQLLDIAATIGADVPIFVWGEDAIGEGIGEQLTSIELPPQRYLLLFPKAHINTAQIFASPNLLRSCSLIDHQRVIDEQQQYLFDLQPPYQNVFEPIVSRLSLDIRQALDYLNYLSTEITTLFSISPSLTPKPRLTGSGSTVFLPLPTLDNGIDFETHQLLSDLLPLWMDHAPCPAQVVTSLCSIID